MPRGPQDKATGAYYTEQRVAAGLCAWALRRAGESCLDPSFGGGVFLAAAAARARALGGGSFHGVELSLGSVSSLPAALRSDPAAGTLLEGDFLNQEPGDLPAVHAVVGNPPFVRFQRMESEARRVAAERARQVGVELSPLAGYWVAFVAHSVRFLLPSGRLAMVVPSELGHAPYARPLLKMLLSEFSQVLLVGFERPLFPHLDQGTLLLLCDGYGEPPASCRAALLSGPEDLGRGIPAGRDIDGAALAVGDTSLPVELAGPEVRLLHGELGRHFPRLGSLAGVESGYVTGANSYFHVSKERRDRLGLPGHALTPAIFRSRACPGARFTDADWSAASLDGSAGWLLSAEGAEDHASVRAALAESLAAGVTSRYKTRTRKPWYRVPRVKRPALFLPAVSVAWPRLIVNEAGAAVPNSFHCIDPVPTVDHRWLAAASLSSVARLSFEVEGHALGGGGLKLDPGEACQVLIPGPMRLHESEFAKVDGALRCDGPQAAGALVDELLVATLPVDADLVARAGRAAHDLARLRRQGRGPW